MRKYLLIITLFIGYFQTVNSQNPRRLLQKLPSLTGKERIDCLIEIAKHYNYVNIDSLQYYATLIHDEATKIGYKHAIAFSFLGLNVKSDSLKMLNLRKAIQLADEINDNEILGWSYYSWIFRLPPSVTKSDKLYKIELLKKSVNYFEKAGDKLREAEVSNLVCRDCSAIGDEDGFDYCKRSIELSRQIQTSVKDWEMFGLVLYLRSLGAISSLYDQGGDYPTALNYLRIAHRSANENQINYRGYSGFEDRMSLLFNKIGQYDSSLYYIQLRLKTQNIPYWNALLGETYLLKKDYDAAQNLFQKVIDSTRNNEWQDPKMRALLGLGKCFEIKKNYKTALTYATEGYNISKTLDDVQYKMDAYEILSRLYHNTGENDSAYHYLKQYTVLKDSAINTQYLLELNRKLNDYKKEAEEAKRIGQIRLLQKDNLIKEQELQQQILLKEQSEAELSILNQSNEIKDQKIKEQLLVKEQQHSQLTLSDKENRLKDQRLKQQAFIRNALLGGLLLFILLGVFVFRNLSLKRKNEKLAVKKGQAELQQKVSELEMQALRAQMNPHFIFNCLNSINRFIFKNETREASDYLTRFSRLIRMVLLHSQKKLVPLEDELEMLKLYLDMERLRFKNAFDYHITTTNAIENSSVFIPPLLLQPFCENAIWHGLMHKDGPGHLNIELNEDNGILNCIITDDGVGREKAEEYKSKSAEKEKSMGLKITKERLSLLNQGTTGGTFYEIEDVRNEQGEIAGTRVQLKIKYKETVEETFDQNILTAENMSKKS